MEFFEQFFKVLTYWVVGIIILFIFGGIGSLL